MRLFGLVLILLLSGQQLMAQMNSLGPVCGLRPADDAPLIARTRAAIDYINQGQLERDDVARYLAVKVHAFHRNDGSGGATDDQVKEGICNLNEFYSDFGTNLQFYLTEINHVFNTNAYEDHWSQGQNAFQNEKDDQVINIYIPLSADFDLTDDFSVAGYYISGSDWIVVGPSNLSGSTLAHEVGHYLSLPHPFRGWDNEFYDPDIHGEQVGIFAPGGFGQNSIKNEFQDGSNCQTAGDLICDTPPDYNHFGPSWGCNYTGGAKDPNGVLIDPDEHNVMAYFSCNTKTMSQGQMDIINADVNLRIAQGNLYELDNPNPGQVGTSVNILPIDSFEIINNANISFEWSAAANAQGYELWIDWVPTFTLDPIIVKTTDPSLVFDGSDLIQNKRYFWRVKPLHDFEICTEFSENTIFFTTVVNSLSATNHDEDLTIFPNPLESGTPLNVDWTAQGENVDWEIRDMKGVLLLQQRSQGGQTAIELEKLTPGIYWIAGKSKTKKATKKFVIH